MVVSQQRNSMESADRSSPVNVQRSPPQQGSDTRSEAYQAAQAQAVDQADALIAELQTYYGASSTHQYLQGIGNHNGMPADPTTLAVAIQVNFDGYSEEIAAPFKVIIRLRAAPENEGTAGGPEGFTAHDDFEIMTAFRASVRLFWDVLMEICVRQQLQRHDPSVEDVRRVMWRCMRGTPTVYQTDLFTYRVTTPGPDACSNSHKA